VDDRGGNDEGGHPRSQTHVAGRKESSAVADRTNDRTDIAGLIR
jgi:hypothetical protein